MEDQVFLLYATELDRTQVRLGQLAAEKAQDDQVRQFAQLIIDYHSQSNARLTQIAQQYGVEIPQGTSLVGKRMQDQLQRLPGPRFDYEYMTSQVIYDYSAHYLYKREERHGLVRRLQREADRQAEQLREHRREAQRIARRLKAGPAGLHLEDSTFLLYDGRGSHAGPAQPSGRRQGSGRAGSPVRATHARFPWTLIRPARTDRRGERHGAGAGD